MKLHLGGNTPHEKILPPYIWKTQNQCHMTTLNTWIGWTPHKVLVSPSRQLRSWQLAATRMLGTTCIYPQNCVQGEKSAFDGSWIFSPLLSLNETNQKKKDTCHMDHNHGQEHQAILANHRCGKPTWGKIWSKVPWPHYNSSQDPSNRSIQRQSTLVVSLSIVHSYRSHQQK